MKRRNHEENKVLKANIDFLKLKEKVIQAEGRFLMTNMHLIDPDDLLEFMNLIDIASDRINNFLTDLEKQKGKVS